MTVTDGAKPTRSPENDCSRAKFQCLQRPTQVSGPSPGQSASWSGSHRTTTETPQARNNRCAARLLSVATTGTAGFRIRRGAKGIPGDCSDPPRTSTLDTWKIVCYLHRLVKDFPGRHRGRKPPLIVRCCLLRSRSVLHRDDIFRCVALWEPLGNTRHRR